MVDEKLLEDLIPRKFNTEDDLHKFTKNFKYTGQKNDLFSLSKSISDPIWELLDRGGKRWRPYMCNIYLNKNRFINSLMFWQKIRRCERNIIIIRNCA